MKEISITVNGIDLDFSAAQSLAREVARKAQPDSAEMAWFDRKQDRSSPPEIECSAENIEGWEEYGSHHGGKRKIVINEGEYIFIFT